MISRSQPMAGKKNRRPRAALPLLIAVRFYEDNSTASSALIRIRDLTWNIGMKNHGPAMQVRGTPNPWVLSVWVPLTWEPGQCWSQFQFKITFLKANRYERNYQLAVEPKACPGPRSGDAGPASIPTSRRSFPRSPFSLGQAFSEVATTEVGRAVPDMIS